MIIIITGCIVISYDKIHNLHVENEIYQLEEQDKARDNFICALDSLYRAAVPTSQLSAKRVVEECEKYGVDPLFVSAQAFIEGHFGTKGLAKKTNSVFNVGAYDGEGAKYMTSYDNPNDSIVPYLNLLTTTYLIGKDEKALMENYTNYKGDRYASNPEYEKQLTKVYNTFYEGVKDEYIKYKAYDIY